MRKSVNTDAVIKIELKQIITFQYLSNYKLY